MKRLSLLIAAALTTAACTSTSTSDNTAANTNSVWPKLPIKVTKKSAEEEKVAEILAGMTLEQKIAQMIQPEIRDVTVEDMRKYGFGSFLNGGGAYPDNNKHATPEDWIALAEAMYNASVDDSLDGSTIPTMWGTDAVHGHNNVIGATLFPHNIGLGAANDPSLIERIAKATAVEVQATGIDWVFAPTVATVRDDRWGRTYESYSEDPAIVKDYSAAIVRGLQGHADKDFLADDRVIATVKHFIGDGGTVKGVDQGNNIDTEADLFAIHGQGYVGGLTEGAQTVMASFNSWHGKKLHGHKYLLTEALKESMGFDGLVVGDWNGHGQIDGCTNQSCPQAINAGLDIFMVPSDWRELYYNTIEQVKQGVIPLSRIDDAVTRILRVKVRAGLFDKPSPAKRKYAGRLELIGHDDHRAIAREAVRKSLVLLKNEASLLPLSPTQNILLAGDAAHNIGKQSGGWTITWQGTNTTNDEFPGGTSIYQGIKRQVEAAGGSVTLSENGEFTDKPDVAIVVFGEEPYAEGVGDRDTLIYQPDSKRDLALLKSLKAQGIPVVAVFISGRPMWVNPELNQSDAFVAAWLPGTEGAGIADVILRDANNQVQYDFTGRLSFSWPSHPTHIVNLGDDDYAPLLPYGFGLSYGDVNKLTDVLSEEYELDSSSAPAITLHARSVQAPWQISLTAHGKKQMVNANTLSVGGMSYRTIDWKVQEDAFNVTFSGDTSELFSISAGDGVNTQQLPTIDSDTVMMLSLQQTKAPQAAVMLGINCSTSTTCQREFNIQPALAGLANNEWHRLAIPMRCIAMENENSLTLKIPMSLRSDSAYSVNLADIAIGSEAEADAKVTTCN